MDGTGCERQEIQRRLCENVSLRKIGNFYSLMLCHLELLMSAEKLQKQTKPPYLLSRSLRLFIPT